jgi:hypothetical protein
VDLLALSDATHAISALNVISEDHVLAQGDNSSRVNNMLNIHASCVNLIVESESFLQRNAALVSANNSTCCSHQHLLSVIIIQKDYSVAPSQTTVQELFGHLEVAVTCDQGSCIDKSIKWRTGFRN